MSLDIPNLDDRRFQDYVDDAKRLVQQRCPEWTDHNVSDPGVTLIETFAFMVDQLTYRLNKVSDRNYVKFLELIGVSLFPPSAAQAPVTFWLTSPQDEPVEVPRGTSVATRREGRSDPVVFETIDNLTIQNVNLTQVLSVGVEGIPIDYSEIVGIDSFTCFGQIPMPGEALLLGLNEAAPANVVALRFECHIEGVGVDPENPPLVWEAYDGGKWLLCEVEQDTTAGLNQPGDIVLHIPFEHEVALINNMRAGWLRCRVTEPEVGQPFYSSAPHVENVAAFTIGGTTKAIHANIIDNEILGLSEGVANQSFTLQHSPVITSPLPHVLEVSTDDGFEEWEEVETFAGSAYADKHFVIDKVAGEVRLGPAVRLEDGSFRNYGAVPPKGAVLRLRQYRSGGGQEGNVAKGALSVLKSPVNFISSVENRIPATGGVDGETLDNAKVRGPISLRTLGRAVTVEDYEHLAKVAAQGIARVHCVPVMQDDQEQGIRVLVVPAVGDDEDGTMPFARLAPSQDLLGQVARELDKRRAIGARVIVEPPFYQGITVLVQLRSRLFADPDRVMSDAKALLYRYLHPITGGPDGTGWPFGRPVHSGEIYAVLQRVSGVELVEQVQLYLADPLTGDRGQAMQHIDMADNALLFSYGHEVKVIPS